MIRPRQCNQSQNNSPELSCISELSRDRCTGTVTDVIIFAVRIDTRLETRRAIEARGRVWVLGITRLIFSVAIDPAPPFVTVDAVFSVDVELFNPRKVGADVGIVFGRPVFVADATVSSVVAFQTSGAYGGDGG